LKEELKQFTPVSPLNSHNLRHMTSGQLEALNIIWISTAFRRPHEGSTKSDVLLM